jgi:galacturonosyltransferase
MVKGTKEIACEDDNLEGIKIKRFASKSSFFSKNVHSFDFEKEFNNYSPDIVITHLLHPHSFKALNCSKKKKIPCYLVTHAPFNTKRNFPLNLITWVHRNIEVRRKIQAFEKIIAISKWEIPYLIQLGIKKDKIVNIPNGIPEEFFKKKKIASLIQGEVLFFGRIAPVKNIETLIYAAKLLPKIKFSFVGPVEKEYLEKLKALIEKIQAKNIKFYPPIFDINKKIGLIDNHRLFVLPSIREGIPQSLLEAMARQKIVLASKTEGAKELIQDGKTGFLFEIGNYKKLASLIAKNIKGNKTVEKQALNESKKYSWKALIKLYPFKNQ